MFGHLLAHTRSSVHINSRCSEWLNDGREKRTFPPAPGGQPRARGEAAKGRRCLPCCPHLAWSAGWTPSWISARPGLGALLSTPSEGQGGLRLHVELPSAPLGGHATRDRPSACPTSFRVPVYQVRLPPEAGPQDGAPRLLRHPPEAQSHPPGLQPPGVLPACVSASWPAPTGGEHRPPLPWGEAGVATNGTGPHVP